MTYYQLILFVFLFHQHASLVESAGNRKSKYDETWVRGPMGIMHNKENRLKSSSVDAPKGRLSKLDFDLTTTVTSNANLIANPSSYANGDDIVVSWNNIQCPHNADWIGVYAPSLYESSSSSYDGYIDWAYVSDISSTYSQGYGQMTFYNVMNLRSPLVFRYYSKNSTCSKVADSTWSLIVSSTDVTPTDVNEPTQIHLSLGDSYESIYIMFVSNSTDVAIVEYGVSADDLSMVTTGSHQTYSSTQMCSSPATLTYPPYFSYPGYQHKVILTQLKSSTTYYYRVGVKDSYSEIKSFTTAPSESNNDIIVKFAAFGDMGAYQTGTLGTIERLTEHVDDFNFVLHIGDISYAEGEGIEWDVFGNIIEPIAGKVPYMVSIGNHEYDHTSGGEHDPSGAEGQGYHPSWGNYGSDSYGECGVPMYYRFSAPASNLSNSIFWYSFAYSPVYIIQMSSEHDFSAGSDQYEWLELTLSTIDRTVHPWVILTTHRPMYCSENYASDYKVAQNMQILLEPLLLSYSVDVVLAGHYHSYERTCALNNYNCVSSGIVHVVVGMAGMSLDSATYMKTDWSIFHDQVFGYSTITASKSSLLFQYMHNSDDTVIDSFELKK